MRITRQLPQNKGADTVLQDAAQPQLPQGHALGRSRTFNLRIKSASAVTTPTDPIERSDAECGRRTGANTTYSSALKSERPAKSPTTPKPLAIGFGNTGWAT